MAASYLSLDDLIADWPQFGGVVPYTQSVYGPAGPEEERRDDGSRIVEYWYVPYELRHTAVNLLLGKQEVLNPAGTPYLSRTPPHQHPTLVDPDGNRYLYATEVARIEGVGVPTRDADGVADQNDASDPEHERPLYQLARLTVYYTWLPYRILPDSEVVQFNGMPSEENWERCVTVTEKSQTDMQTLPLSSFRYVDGSATVVPGHPGRIEVKTDVTVRWWRVPPEALGSRRYHPTPTAISSFPLDEFRGTVNLGAFNGYREGTLLYLGADYTPVQGRDGQRLYDVDLRFQHFDGGQGYNPSTGNFDGEEAGHNFILKKIGAGAGARVGYFEITTTGSTNIGGGLYADNVSLFNYRDFTKLFRPPV